LTETTVNAALDMAVLHRQPPKGVIMHSDRRGAVCPGKETAMITLSRNHSSRP
jgi:transposase InsO family protein